MMMKVAHLGTFDVDNYGDLLFPLIAEWRLPSVEWVHVSPVGEEVSFADAVDVIGVSGLQGISIDALVVGGGNIVHLRRSPIKSYVSVGAFAYPSLILGALKHSFRRAIPLIFNGPSIRRLSMGYIERNMLKWVFRSANYSALRDEYSAAWASENGARQVALIPDTAFDISRMWPLQAEACSAYKKKITVHVNNRYGGCVHDTARAIDRVSQVLGGEVCFLPIGPCHGDIEYMQVIRDLMKEPWHEIADFSLRGFAHAIAQSSIYVGSSMHGFITAMSYGVPGLLVLNDEPMEKFRGLLRTLGAPESVICKTWEEASRNIERAWLPAAEVRERLFSDLDEHWHNVNAALNARCMPDHAPYLSTVLGGWRVLVMASQFEVRLRSAVVRVRVFLLRAFR